jgi:RHS repeat-associated protein
MTSYSGPNGTGSYSYRADGMRVAKSVTANGSTTATSYAYDGQMGFEDTDVSGGSTTVNDYGLGARGIDWISRNTGSGPNIQFPCYDAHGNMVATISRAGSSYNMSNERSFDAWGAVREGKGAGDPKGRYCANLGHKQDDETGLVYMRARYYDPGSGRFLSEDPGYQGSNLFVFCGSDPVNQVDESGNESKNLSAAMGEILFILLSAMIVDGFFGGRAGMTAGIIASLLDYFVGIGEFFGKRFFGDLANSKISDVFKVLQTEEKALDSPAGIAAQDSLAGEDVEAAAAEVGEIEVAFMEMDLDD